MEWTWLKDWWRLKKLRRNKLARHGAGERRRSKSGRRLSCYDDGGEETGSSCYDDDDVCFCDDCMNVRYLFY